MESKTIIENGISEAVKMTKNFCKESILLILETKLTSEEKIEFINRIVATWVD